MIWAIETKFPWGEVTINVISVIELVVLPDTRILSLPNSVSADKVMTLGFVDIIPESDDLTGIPFGGIVEPITVNCISAVFWVSGWLAITV